MQISGLFLICATILLINACAIKDYPSTAKPINHALWDTLVSEYVAENGDVNYKGFVKDSLKLNKYLNLLESAHPNKSWTRDEKLAYWINAYNAFTIKLIVDNYPVASIKDIKNGIPFVNTVWDIKFINIEGAEYDLNNIEHNIIRPKFKEPRIHFAVNCASISCPRLRNEAYTADKLDAQLSDQTRYFLGNPKKNDLSNPNKIKLSKLFTWFSGDFKETHKSVIDFINDYAEQKVSKDAEIEYFEYDWGLNDIEAGVITD